MELHEVMEFLEAVQKKKEEGASGLGRELYNLERYGRTIATYARDKPVGRALESWLTDVLTNVYAASALLDERGEKKLSRLARGIFEFASALAEDIEQYREWELLVVPSKAPAPRAAEACIYADMGARPAVGERCTWLCGEVEKEKYTVSAAVNDLSACIHRLADKLAVLEKMFRHSHGKCLWSDDADPTLVEACKAWDETTVKFLNNRLYDSSDYAALRGWIRGRRAEFRVGSTPGHKTHLDLERGRVEYYDTDRDVSEEMKKLFEEEGLKCEVTYEGCFCEGLTEENAARVARVLASATSMDLRIPVLAWWKDAAQKIPEIRKCRDEACRVKLKISH